MRQARWAQEHDGYDFKTPPRPGRQNGQADYLSRCPENRLAKLEDKNSIMILKPDHIGDTFVIPLAHKDRICAIPPIQWQKDFLMEVRDATREDQQNKSGLQSLSTN